MTSQTTTIQSRTTGLRTLLGAAAASLVLVGGALLWQARPASESGAITTTGVSSITSDGVAPLGGMAELYAEQQAAAQAEAVLQERIGGMAELYRAQELARPMSAAGAGGATRDGCGLDARARTC
jgi:hypothetical protein